MIDLRKHAPERPFTDDLTGEADPLPVHRATASCSRLYYLFDTPIQQACKTVGLVPGRRECGTRTRHRHRPPLPPHRRHPARRARREAAYDHEGPRSHAGSRWRWSTPRSATKKCCATIRQYWAPGATIAGPAAARARRRRSARRASIDWLKTNFFKTELELGHCLRLPAEGPCECDLYLTCAKFVTTSEYAPRLRARLEVEQELMLDAVDRGWDREVERHTAISGRICELLSDLGESTQRHTDRKDPNHAHLPAERAY